MLSLCVQLGPALLPLTPSTELDVHSAALYTRATLKNSNRDSLHAPTNYTDLLAEDVTENAEDHLTTFKMTLLTQDVMHRMEPESVGVNHSYDLSAPTLDVNDMTQNLLEPTYSTFLLNEEDVYGLSSRLTGLLEDSTVLDGTGLPDLSLEEGFSPGMVARIQEEGYPVHEVAQQKTGRNYNLIEAQDQPARKEGNLTKKE